MSTVPKAQPNNRCFACGEGNPHGLQLRFAPDGAEAVRAQWRTEEAWEGFRGVIHGGIVSTVLDEAMSKAVSAQGVRALTCELRVRLRQSVAPAEELEVRAWVVEKRKRRIMTEAVLSDGEGRERAHAWGTFLELPA
ncbi:MAG TPA: PaaI family thioesterase [Bryobacteraceae bacterium]|nr:PaaI family thioesterase [Bryobacteraceae bacterium]